MSQGFQHLRWWVVGITESEDLNMEKIKWLLSAIMGIVSTFTEHYGVMIVLVICAIVFDFATGIIKAKINGTINSATSTKGLFKKVALLTCLFFGFFLDYAIPYMCSSISIELPFNTPFGLIMCFYIVLNECISICENLYECDNSIMPKWIVNILLKAREQIEDGGSVEDLQEK